MRLTFYGTGGGRFCTIKQLRKTAGIYFKSSDTKLWIDPGPGALTTAAEEEISLDKLDGVLVTHNHLDHVNDAEALIEGMTKGCKKERGTLIANKTSLEGAETQDGYIDPEISRYHRQAVEDIIEMEDGEKGYLGKLEFEFKKSRHQDPHTMMFKLNDVAKQETLGFVTDTSYFDQIADFFQGVDLLILNVLRPKDADWETHLNTRDAFKIIKQVKPKKAILHHFGVKMIYSSVYQERDWLKDKLEEEGLDQIKVKFPKDGETIDTSQAEDDDGLRKYLNGND